MLASAVSLKYLVKKAPEGYSQAKIQEIYEKYVGSEEEQNEETAAAVEAGGAEWGDCCSGGVRGRGPADEYYLYHERESFRPVGGWGIYDEYRVFPVPQQSDGEYRKGKTLHAGVRRDDQQL